MVEKKKVFYIRRAIFLLTAAAVAIPLMIKVEFPMIVSWPAQNLYDFVDKVPPDKIVVVSTSWSAGSQGECAPQTAALIHHLAKTGKRFAIWSFSDIQGPELTQKIAEPVTKEYNREYGVDWVNWGYKTGASAMIRGWAKDIRGTVKEDIKGTPAEDLPFMENARSHEDIGLIVDISAGALAGTNTVNYYIQFLKGLYNVPVGYGCTGVMAPEAFPYLDSGQIVGMMRGLAGAAEYEALVGFSGDATRRMTAQSFAHILIIILIIVGNAGYFLSKRRRKTEEGQLSAPRAPSPTEEQEE